MSTDEDIVRKFEEERAGRAEASHRTRRRNRVLARAVAWIVALFFVAMSIASLYLEYPVLAQILADYQEGWLPGEFLVVLLLLVFGLIALLVVWIVWLWRTRHSTDA